MQKYPAAQDFTGYKLDPAESQASPGGQGKHCAGVTFPSTIIVFTPVFRVKFVKVPIGHGMGLPVPSGQ